MEIETKAGEGIKSSNEREKQASKQALCFHACYCLHYSLTFESTKNEEEKKKTKKKENFITRVWKGIPIENFSLILMGVRSINLRCVHRWNKNYWQRHSSIADPGSKDASMVNGYKI